MESTKIGSFTRLSYPSNIIVDIHSLLQCLMQNMPVPRIIQKLPMGMMEENLFTKIIDEFSKAIAKTMRYGGM